MDSNDQYKKRKIYFFLLSIERNKDNSVDSIWNGEQASSALTRVLNFIISKNAADRAYHHEAREKYIWLHEHKDLGNGNYNIVFMSGRYNQSREVVATPSLTEKGIPYERTDAPKERTHMCIRLAKGQDRFLVALESNRDGIYCGTIALYLNEMFNQLNASSEEVCSYEASFTPLPSKDFLEEVEHMKKISVLSIRLDRQDLKQSDFIRVAELNDISDSVELVVKRRRGQKFNIPIDIVREYYGNTGATKTFKRLTVQGASKSGSSLQINTDAMQMQRSISVRTWFPTNEVDSNDFFQKAQEFIYEVGG